MEEPWDSLVVRRGNVTCMSRTLVNLLTTGVFFLLNPSIWYLFECHDRVQVAITRRIENRLLLCPNIGSSAWWEFAFCAASKLNGLESYLCCYQVATPHLSCPDKIHLLKHVFVFVISKEELPANLGGKFCTAFRNVKLSLLILVWPL